MARKDRSPLPNTHGHRCAAPLLVQRSNTIAAVDATVFVVPPARGAAMSSAVVPACRHASHTNLDHDDDARCASVRTLRCAVWGARVLHDAPEVRAVERGRRRASGVSPSPLEKELPGAARRARGVRGRAERWRGARPDCLSLSFIHRAASHRLAHPHAAARPLPECADAFAHARPAAAGPSAAAALPGQ